MFLLCFIKLNIRQYGLIYRTKLNVTKEQLADQRAYLQQLKTVEADKLTIEREKTVEKQLRKKEVHNLYLALDLLMN